MADETFSAKQIARRIGTDAKTFRKWLRSTASPYKAVGQGQRYEFPQVDLPKIDKAFHAWKDRAGKKPLPPVNGKPKPVTEVHTRAELAAARDEEYGTIDGEYPEEPTEHEIWLLEQDTENWDENDPRWIDAGPSSAGNPDTFDDGHGS